MFTAKRICKFVLPIGPIHLYPALVDVIMLVCWASLRSAPTGKKHATAPEFQPPVCCAFPAVLLRSGSWWTPTRGDPDGQVTERSWLGKGERAISRARSINWGVGAAGACGRLDKRDLKADAFPLPASRFPLPASRSTLKAQRPTLNVQGPRFTVYGWESEQGHCPAEGHAVQPRGSAWHGRADGWEGVKDPRVQPRTRI